MSHFTVLVIGENPEEQLAPFDERLKKEFVDKSEECENEYKTESRNDYYGDHVEIRKLDLEKLSKLKTGELLTYKKEKIDPFEYFTKNKKYKLYHRDNNEECVYVEVAQVLSTGHPDPDVCFEGEVILKKIDPPKRVPLNEYYSDYESYLKDWHGYEDTDEIGYWTNPEAKWDWYLLGGRWNGR